MATLSYKHYADIYADAVADAARTLARQMDRLSDLNRLTGTQRNDVLHGTAQDDGILGLAYRDLDPARDLTALLRQQGVDPALTWPWPFPTGHALDLSRLNDVLAAQVVGMAGVLVRTGKFRQATLDRWATDEFAMQPNHVIDSVADLPALLDL